MDSGDKNKVEGLVDEKKGETKEGLGRLRNDQDQQNEGHADQTEGEVKQAVGDVKNKAKDLFKKN